MPSILGLTSSIVINGVELDEYQVKSVNETTSECYIISEVGKEFQIKGRVDDNEDDCQFSIQVDGIRVGAWLIEVGKGETMHIVDRAIVQSGYESSLAFAALTTTDDDNLLEQGQNVDNVGTIRVTWHSCIPLTKREMQARRKELIEQRSKKAKARKMGPQQVAQIMPGANTVHEVTKKLTSHCVQLSNIHKVRESRRIYVESHKRGKKLATMTFYYRSKAFLQAQGIIPSTPAREIPEIIDMSSVEDDSDEHNQITLREVSRISSDVRQEESRTQSRRKNATPGPSNTTRFSTSDPVTVTTKEEMEDVKPGARDSDSDDDYAELAEQLQEQQRQLQALQVRLSQKRAKKALKQSGDPRVKHEQTPKNSLARSSTGPITIDLTSD